MKKIVTIGGGTGSFMLLSGLKHYPLDITAVVSMADDGGSTGRLRDELGVLPPGDVRQCLVALSDSSDTLRTLMGYRFEEGSFQGHSFGNLFLSALEKITGSFSAGVEEAAQILNVKGHVVPVSNDDMRLRITLADGSVMDGEKELDGNAHIRQVGIDTVDLATPAHANPKAVDAIMAADCVVIGPGDHFGSIVPNLLVPGIQKALRATTATVVFVAPLTNKHGHTSNFTLHDHVQAIETLIGRDRIDYVVYNTKEPSAALVAQYEQQEGDSLVAFDSTQPETRSYKVICGDFLSSHSVPPHKGDALAHQRAFIRHDSTKLARGVALIVEYSDAHSYEIV